MKIEIVTKNLNNDKLLREFAQSKVQFVLERLDTRISEVVVRLDNRHSDATQFDGECRIDVRTIPTGVFHVSANGNSAFDAILQATRKMQHAIRHEIDRSRTSSRIRHEKARRQDLNPVANADSIH